MKPGDRHIHRLKIAFLEKDRIREEWTSFEKGSLKGVAVLDLARQKT